MDYFYPRSPCGERQTAYFFLADGIEFLSTLSLRRATVHALKLANAMLFLSTLSLRRATAQHFPTLHNILISIHALLAESDNSKCRCPPAYNHFYPRSPCGERRRNSHNINRGHHISIHALLAESDKALGLLGWLRVLISIHALLAESDERVANRATQHWYISIHALLAESDAKLRLQNLLVILFLSTLSLRRATRTIVI